MKLLREGKEQLMDEVQVFHIDHPGYVVISLTPEHTPALQKLYESCADFNLLVDGEDVSPTSAQEEFQSVPPGRSLDDKFLYGLQNPQGELVGVLEGMRRYPDDYTWWIGLLMLRPEARGKSLGRKVVEGFYDHARSQECRTIMLGVVEQNMDAYHFWQRMGFDLAYQTEPRPFGRKMHRVFVMRRAVV